MIHSLTETYNERMTGSNPHCMKSHEFRLHFGGGVAVVVPSMEHQYPPVDFRCLTHLNATLTIYVLYISALLLNEHVQGVLHFVLPMRIT